jgi:hypothetical protein
MLGLVLLAEAASFGAIGCWPGRCDGGFRGLHSVVASDESGITVVPSNAAFTVNVDSSARDEHELETGSGVTADALFLEGASGRVPANLTFRVYKSAHSCASAASIQLTPREPLPPGEYVLVLLLDVAHWPAISDSDIERWQGHPAMVRRYRVR